MSRLAIIPARGGSKRIKKKNIKDFCGQPMISHIINTAIQSHLFDKIHISTDSFEIKNIVEKLNMEIDFMRPSSLSEDFTPLMPVLSYVVKKFEELNYFFDEIWLLMACAPLIEAKDLQNASKLYSNQKCLRKPIMAISEYPAPIEWSYLLNKSYELDPRFKGKFKVRSQDLPKSYYDSGTFIVFSREDVLESQGAGSNEDFLGYILPKKKAIDIDTEEDWELAEALFSKMNI